MFLQYYLSENLSIRHILNSEFIKIFSWRNYIKGKTEKQGDELKLKE